MADIQYICNEKKDSDYPLLNSPDPRENPITIDSIDYYMGPLNRDYNGNKGGNSFVYKLYLRPDYDDGNEEPTSIIKISKNKEYYNIQEKKPKKCFPKNDRFRREVDALQRCKEKGVLDIIEIFDSGNIYIRKDTQKGNTSYQSYPYYTMEVADCDLKSYMEAHYPEMGLDDKISICLDIAKAISSLLSLGYYHRDLKPDNIFVVKGQFKVGDLGLISKRNEDYDKKGEFIGPRGWTTPETMNKYLTEDKSFGEFDVTIDQQSDIFQLGMIFWYIMQGNAPIGELRQEDFKVKRNDIYCLIHHMLNHSKSKRIKTIGEVVAELERIQQKLISEKFRGSSF